MGKGGKNRKRGTNKNEPQRRELVLKEEGQEYAQITKNLGGNRLECMCADGSKCIGVIRGAIRRKMWICVGDIVLVSTREYEEGKVDVLSRYTPDEAKQLIKGKHIPPQMQVNDDDTTRNQGVVEFVAMDSDEDSSEDEYDVLAQRGYDEAEAQLGRDTDDDERGALDIDDI